MSVNYVLLRKNSLQSAKRGRKALEQETVSQKKHFKLDDYTVSKLRTHTQKKLDK